MEYYIIIAGSLTIIISYFFNRIAHRFNIPSVLLLVLLGIIINQAFSILDLDHSVFDGILTDFKLLEILGTSGLILIVLEASLELKLQKNKIGVITKALFIALLGLLICIGVIGSILFYTIDGMTWQQALVYATPLSILSSAIVIPSVENLSPKYSDFFIYESTFSDILGIMAFYFLIELGGGVPNENVISSFFLDTIITLVTSITLSYLLIYLFQKLDTKVKLFLMISVLFLLFSIGKLVHLSSLLIILVFGLVLKNHSLFFIGKLKKLVIKDRIESVHNTFLIITQETAFVIRTFFFVIFGFSITLNSLFNLYVSIISVLVILGIYLSRYLVLSPFKIKNKKFATTIAPRGLITILLFYSIPEHIQQENFEYGILLYVIIISGIIMTSGLIKLSPKVIEVPVEENDQIISKSDDPIEEDIELTQP